MKKQILMIGVLILFAGLAINPAISKNIPESEIQEQTINVEYAMINSDGALTTEKIELSEQEFVELQYIISELMEKLESADDLYDISDIIDSIFYERGLFGFEHPILNWILNFLSLYKLPRSRAYVISQGWGFKINPFKNHNLNLYRPLTIWQYSEKWGYDIPGITFILRPSPFNTELLHGKQIGMMTHFFGLYIFVSQPVPQKSWTFFMGSVRHIFGIDFALSPSW
jgi:hypothetical protein